MKRIVTRRATSRGRRAMASAIVVALAVFPDGVPAAMRAAPWPASRASAADHVVPGITVLLEDSVRLIGGKRVGLFTNQTGVDRSGASDIELLSRSILATRAAVRLVALLSPEHGIKGREDREFVPGGIDSATRVPVYSLYGATTLAPPDSVLRQLDVLVIDLQDVGTRTWTYVASTVYAMRAAARMHVPIIVLDRPNPISGTRVEGPMLDSLLANPNEAAPGRRALPYALASIPLRHGLTMGELARYYNDRLALGAELHVIPMRGWRRASWFDETGLPESAVADQRAALPGDCRVRRVEPVRRPRHARSVSADRGTVARCPAGRVVVDGPAVVGRAIRRGDIHAECADRW